MALTRVTLPVSKQKLPELQAFLRQVAPSFKKRTVDVSFRPTVDAYTEYNPDYGTTGEARVEFRPPHPLLEPESVERTQYDGRQTYRIPPKTVAVQHVRSFGKRWVNLYVTDFDAFSALLSHFVGPQEGPARVLAGSVIGVDPFTETFKARFHPLWQADQKRALDLIFEDKRDLLLSEMARASVRQGEAFAGLSRMQKNVSRFGIGIVVGALIGKAMKG